jgi:hypothetical protein
MTSSVSGGRLDGAPDRVAVTLRSSADPVAAW